MRTASILLALSFVFGFVSDADAKPAEPVEHWYRVRIGEHYLGFTDHRIYKPPMKDEADRIQISCLLWLGPLGTHKVPFTATQNLVGCCLIAGTLIIIPIVLTVRWKKKRAAQ
jgi:hypothetical protein